MTKRTFSKIIAPLFLLTILALSMASCSRGYGCPYGMQKSYSRR